MHTELETLDPKTPNKEMKNIEPKLFEELSVQVYNRFLPNLLCAHCGLELGKDQIWSSFNIKDIKSNTLLFESLVNYPEDKLFELYSETFKTRRYCCKMSILESYLSIKNALSQHLIAQTEDSKQPKKELNKEQTRMDSDRSETDTEPQ